MNNRRRMEAWKSLLREGTTANDEVVNIWVEIIGKYFRKQIFLPDTQKLNMNLRQLQKSEQNF